MRSSAEVIFGRRQSFYLDYFVTDVSIQMRKILRSCDVFWGKRMVQLGYNGTTPLLPSPYFIGPSSVISADPHDVTQITIALEMGDLT